MLKIVIDYRESTDLVLAIGLFNNIQNIENQIFTIWQSPIAKFSSMPDKSLQMILSTKAQLNSFIVKELKKL